METRELTCIICPMGCRITVIMDDSEVISVTGNTCKRGEVYARTEVVAPVRTVTTTIKVNGGAVDRVSCKTQSPVQKDKIFEVMAEIGASCDGRRKSEPFSANYSPSLYAKIRGPVSILESFTKPDLVDAMNGGPLTLEFSSSMFHDAESVQKIALFVKAFVHKGGHQLQCNSVNLNDLKDAQINPEKYRHLIVRIWGWSAYFIELDKEFQNHVIARQEYSL